MTGKWMKAIFLILLGFILLIYSDGLVDDLERNAAEEFNVSFEWTWELVRILLWILIAWLFVDGVLIIVLSFKEDRYTLVDVMNRLKAIEKKVTPVKMRAAAAPAVVEQLAESEAVESVYPSAVEEPSGPPEPVDEEPPPPLE